MAFRPTPSNPLRIIDLRPSAISLSRVGPFFSNMTSRPVYYQLAISPSAGAGKLNSFACGDHDRLSTSAGYAHKEENTAMQDDISIARTTHLKKLDPQAGWRAGALRSKPG